mmetsp:Transcript_42851/g.79886  ORF Transcript_42851/g.79886 Transcript_42851/m.79886 type:complete len:181 (-) Transcript_42851:265-807(-)
MASSHDCAEASEDRPSLHPELRARLQALSKESAPADSRSVDEKDAGKKAKGGLDSDVDSLLQQLDALDSRSQALQREDKRDHARWRKDDQESAKGKGEAAAKAKDTPVAAAQQHPLQAVEIMQGVGEREVRLRPQKKRADLRTAPFASGSVVALPPLKASASAPCLVSGPFLRERHLSKA